MLSVLRSCVDLCSDMFKQHVDCIKKMDGTPQLLPLYRIKAKLPPLGCQICIQSLRSVCAAPMKGEVTPLLAPPPFR